MSCSGHDRVAAQLETGHPATRWQTPCDTERAGIENAPKYVPILSGAVARQARMICGPRRSASGPVVWSATSGARWGHPRSSARWRRRVMDST